MNSLLSLLAAQQSQGSPLGILILVVPFGLLIWLMVMPQRKQRARQQALMSKLAVGEEVVTTGGIVGQITHMEDDLVHMEVDHDVVIRVAKSAIARSLDEATSAPAPASKSRGGLLGGLMGGGSSAAADDADQADSPGSKSSGTGVGTARSGTSKSAAGKGQTPKGGSRTPAKAGARKK